MNSLSHQYSVANEQKYHISSASQNGSPWDARLLFTVEFNPIILEKGRRVEYKVTNNPESSVDEKESRQYSDDAHEEERMPSRASTDGKKSRPRPPKYCMCKEVPEEC